MTTTSYNIYQQITSVRLASTINLVGSYFNGALNNGVGATLTASSVGLLLVDGILTEVGDRLLLNNQTDPTQNGIYVVQYSGSSSGLWMIERSPDFQSLEQMKVGQYFSVGAGDTLSGSLYVLVEPLPTTIGMGTFNFENVADSAAPVGPYLLKANNLSDLDSQLTAYQNFGMGDRIQVTLTDSSFPFSLTNPCPNIITLDCSSPGNVLQLPDAQGPQAFQLFNGPEIINIGSQTVDIVSFLGIPQTPSTPGSDFDYLLTDNSTTGGLWDARGHITTLNGKTGNVILESSDSSVTITPSVTSSVIDLKVSGESGSSPPQLLYLDSVDGNDSNDGSISKSFLTYEAARLYAVDQGASNTKPYSIIPVGIFNITGNLTITPWVNVLGQGASQSIFNLSGGIVNDTAWYTTDNAMLIVEGCSFIAPSGLSAIFNGGNGNLINYMNCDFSQTTTFTTSTSNTSTVGNTVVIQNSIEFDAENFGGGTTINDSYVTLIGGSLINVNINATGNGSSAGSVLSIVQGELSGTVNINSSTGTGGFAVLFANAAQVYATVNLIGANTAYGADAASYYTVPNFSAGASISNVQIASLADSVAQTTFTPSRYAPTNGGGTNPWAISSLTANLAGIDAALGSPPQLLYLDSTDGSDSNVGTIAKPFLTYEAARLYAVAHGASAATPFSVIPIGVFNITGNMTLTPYVSISGVNFYQSIFIVTGQLLLDTTWGSVTNPQSMVNNVMLSAAGGFNLVYSAYQNNSSLYFENCNFSGTPTAVATGSGTSNLAESISFNSCVGVFFGDVPAYTFTNLNVNMFLSDATSGISAYTTNEVNADVLIQSMQFFLGNPTFSGTGTGDLFVLLEGCPNNGSNLTIDGTAIQVDIEAGSYQFDIIFSGGATIDQVFLSSATDGLNASGYSPVNFTPVPTSSYSYQSLTAYIAGIDSALAKPSGSATLVGGTVTVSSSTVTAGDFIGLTATARSGVPGNATLTINPGVSFTITSDSITDATTYKWKNFGV
jgi:hypothetical protein